MSITVSKRRAMTETGLSYHGDRIGKWMEVWRVQVSYVGFTARSVGQMASRVAGRPLQVRHTLGMIAAKSTDVPRPGSPNFHRKVLLFVCL